jgi:FlgD Ig-like domain
MPMSSRVFTTVAALALSTTLVGAALAAPSASIEQVRNGTASATTTPTPAWGTGNAGASNSHYLESHSIAYRTVMDQLPTDGTVIELVLGYNVKRSGSYAIDYLTQYQRLLPHVLFAHRDPEFFDPLKGVTGVAPVVTTAPIPITTRNLVIDPDGSDPDPAMAQPSTSMASLPSAERVMTLFGGNLIDVSYVTEGDVNLATGSSESQVRVRFTATSPRVVLAWGGHIACRWDWGFNPNGSPRSAGGISGSSYHMKLVGWNLGSLGNQDRSMSTDAVFPVPRCGISNLGPFCAGSNNTHVAPAGMESYSWSLTDNSSGASIVGSNIGTSVVVNSGTLGGSYRIVLTTGASGFTKQCDALVTVNMPVTADAGVDLESCASSPQVQLTGVVGGGTGTWSGGAGTFNPNATTLNALYTPTAAEIAAGGVTLTLTCNPPTGPCPPASDQARVTIRPAATANAGPDQTVCASSPQAQLAGVIGGGATSGVWSGGAGTFTPGAGTLNATYLPTSAEISAGGVTLTLTTNDPDGPCAATSDPMRITINPAATADAGLEVTVCASSPQAQLVGAVGGGATSGTWSGGAGSFSPNNAAMNAIYTPTAAEIAAGGVTLTLTTNDPAGPCATANDQVRITINAAATTNAGLDLIVCASSPQTQLAGAVGGGATSGMWSGGAGSFSPGATILNATYTPTAAEIAAGGVTLTLTTNDPTGPCAAVSDQVRIAINPSATVSAGSDVTVCANNPQAQLSGSVGGGAASGTWSGGAGSFSPKATTLGATYTPTAAEIAAGSVTLTLTSNDPVGPCGSVSDQVKITIDPITIVNAGPDQIVCSSSASAHLQGSVSGTVLTGTWSGGAGSFSPGASSLNATYTPTAAEIAAGAVTLTLTSSASSGPCPPASDQVRIAINPAVTANAGPDQTVCAAAPQVQLAGSLGNGATSGTWSGGAGTFVPNATTLSATYTPSAAEVSAGSVTLTLTSNDPSGPCPAVSDAMKITYDAPTVTVTDRTVCSGILSVTLCANAGHGVAPYTYLWNTGATTSCITATTPGSYTVTVTDAKGCKATGSGAFVQRDCIGQLAHTTTTCATFQNGTANALSDVHWVIRDNIITSISPGVFFYYTKVQAPSADFTVHMVQTRSSDAFPFLTVQQDQVSLYDADCNRLGTGTETTPGQGSVDVHGATVNQVFIISVKYSLKTLVGTYMDETMGCHYDFRTEINGHVVDADPNGIQIGVPAPPTGGVGETVPGGQGETMFSVEGGSPGAGLPSDAEGLELYRATPNPFSDGMRMAYAVGKSGERVNISVYDLAGRLVRTLANETQSAGRHSVAWNGQDEQGSRMRRGVYFIHARVGNQARLVRVTFLK